jgi:hypothetical protein
LAVKTTFAEKLAFMQNADNSELSLLRYDGDLDATLLNEEHRVSGFALHIIFSGPLRPTAYEQITRRRI